MSGSTGQKVLGGIGAVVGFIYGGPGGASLGYSIGSAIGGAVDPPLIQGPTIGELAVQTAREGVPRPIVFGTSRPIAGNVIATTEPIIRKKREKQGKGGGAEVESEEVYRTYAIRICEGPITGIRRVWRNGKLVYDTSNLLDTVVAATLSIFPEEFLANGSISAGNSAQFLQKATFYMGDYDQMPDPVLQAAFGVDNVVAHRGTAYMVIDNENLTQLGGAIPQYVFEVERCEGFMLTSHPYPIEVSDSVDAWFDSVVDGVYPFDIGAVDSSFESVTGDLRAPLNEYTIPPEGIDSTFESVTGELDSPLNVYTDYPPEGIDAAFVSITGELGSGLVTYTNYPPEAVDSSFVSVTGSLT